MSWVQWTTLVMQIWILFMVAGSAWYAWRTQKATGATLNAIREYRREIGWLTTRLEILEQGQQKAMGQGNVRAENGRGK
jgi:biopolymer transport protein ExbB/TolQ